MSYMILASAFRATNDEATNLKRNSLLRAALESQGIEVNARAVDGCFKEEGQDEYSVELTLQAMPLSWGKALTAAEVACESFAQDCILVVDMASMEASLLSANEDGYERTVIGHWRQSTKADALASGAYTRVHAIDGVLGEAYFICE